MLPLSLGSCYNDIGPEVPPVLRHTMLTSHKRQNMLTSPFQALEPAQEMRLFCQCIHDPVSQQPAMSPFRSLGGLRVWLLWKGTCQIKPVDGDAEKQGEGKLGIFAFFPKIWHILLLSPSVPALWTSPLPNRWCLECTVGIQIAVSRFHHSPQLLGTKQYFFYLCVHIGHKSLGGRDCAHPVFPCSLRTYNFAQPDVSLFQLLQ